MNYGARFYDPAIGRFTSIDPLAFKYASYSPYNYVLNNPTLFIDPDGREPELKRDKFGNIIFEARGSTNSIRHPSGQSAIVQPGVVFAVDGTEIAAFNNVSSNACFDTDCQGVSFTSGELWINNDQVDKIITGDNLKEIERSEAMVGDVVVYRDKDGNVEHSMTISAIDADNNEILVKGLGGMETEVSETSIDKAWKKGAIQSIYRMPNEMLKEDSYVMPKDQTNVGSGGDNANGFK